MSTEAQNGSLMSQRFLFVDFVSKTKAGKIDRFRTNRASKSSLLNLNKNQSSF